MCWRSARPRERRWSCRRSATISRRFRARPIQGSLARWRRRLEANSRSGLPTSSALDQIAAKAAKKNRLRRNDMRRQKKFYAWGYADEDLSPEEIKPWEAEIAERYGVKSFDVAPPPKADEIALRAPRVEVPSALQS